MPCNSGNYEADRHPRKAAHMRADTPEGYPVRPAWGNRDSRRSKNTQFGKHCAPIRKFKAMKVRGLRP